MTAVSEAASAHVHVPELNSVVHRAREKEVARVVVRHFPDWLAVLSERLGAAGSHEVPDFDSAIGRG